MNPYNTAMKKTVNPEIAMKKERKSPSKQEMRPRTKVMEQLMSGKPFFPDVKFDMRLVLK